jgi:hypothetical protein
MQGHAFNESGRIFPATKQSAPPDWINDRLRFDGLLTVKKILNSNKGF